MDEEPDPDADAGPVARDTVWLRPARKAASDRHVCLESGKLYDNGAPEGARAIAIDVIEFAEDRNCCGGASKARLQPQRYGAPFFMGNALPEILERLSPPLDKPGLPMGGRRAITFSDSRQGVARLAAKLQQDAERTLTRSFLYHAVQEDQGLSGEERSKLERKLKLYQEDDPAGWADEIAEIKKRLSGTVKPLPWNALISRFGEHAELKEFATKVWAERDWGGREMAENSAKLAEMFLYRELFRRPRVQNNAETMGLVQLMFPDLETKARRSVPRVLQQVGVDADGWAGLAQAAVDAVFRDSLAIDIRDWWMVRWVSPRWGKMQAICRAGLAPQDVPAGSRSTRHCRRAAERRQRGHLHGSLLSHPLNFRLLHEVLATLPGKDAGMRIEIATAQLGRSERAGYQAYHPYIDDHERQAVLERLFPGAKVSVLPKAQQPHARSLKLKLSDGRSMQILFDQGFGAWRTSGSARHDFLASPDRQVADIKRSDIRVHVAEKDGAPAIIEFL